MEEVGSCVLTGEKRGGGRGEKGVRSGVGREGSEGWWGWVRGERGGRKRVE